MDFIKALLPTGVPVLADFYIIVIFMDSNKAVIIGVFCFGS